MEEFTNLLTEFSYPKEETERSLKQMESVTFGFLHSSVKDKASNVDILMNQRFNQIFNTDKTTGAPRRWKTGDNITQDWKIAKRDCEHLLDLFGRIRLSEKDFNSAYFEFDPDAPIVKSRETEIENKDHIILTRTEAERNLQRFREYANTAYSYAQKEMERAEVKGQIPIYFLVLLFILGWNELLWVIQMILFNPLLLFFMILLAGVAVIIWRLKLTPVLVTAVVMFMDEGRQYIKYKLRQEEQKPPPTNDRTTNKKGRNNKKTPPESNSKTKTE